MEQSIKVLLIVQMRMLFYSNLSHIKPVWDKQDEEMGRESKFYDWFVRYKSDDFTSGTLHTTREAAGLGCPLEP